MAVGAVNGSGMPIVFPPSVDTNSSTPATEEEQTTSLGYTPVTSDLYYSGGIPGDIENPRHRPERGGPMRVQTAPRL